MPDDGEPKTFFYIIVYALACALWFVQGMRASAPVVALYIAVTFIAVFLWHYLNITPKFNSTVAREFGRTFCDEK